MATIIPIVPYLENFFYLANGKKVVLAPHQKKILTHAFTPDKNGKLPYKQVVYSAPKKSGKTAVGAMIASWFAFSGIGEMNGELYCCANDLEQSQGRVFAALKQSVEMSKPLLTQTTVVQEKLIKLKNGTRIAAIAGDYAGAAGANPELSLFDELWGFRCLNPDEIKVLTVDGFKSPYDVSENDQLATLSAKGVIELQHPTALNWHDYDGKMLKFKHRRGSFSVTPNHRVLGTFTANAQDRSDILNGKQERVMEYITAQDASAKAFGWIKQTAEYVGERYETIQIENETYPADPFFELLGWFLSEGSIQSRVWGVKSYPGAVKISQSRTANPDKFSVIEDCVNRCGLNPVSTDNDVIIYNSRLARYFSQFGRSHEKFYPRQYLNASKEQLGLFLTAYLSGDGWKTGSGGWQAYTVSPQLAEDLLEIGLRVGYAPRLMNVRKKNPKHQPIYRLSFSGKDLAWERRMNHWTEVHHTGKVWCPTTPNGNFYVKTIDGTCFWTGNSESSRRLFEEMTPSPARYNSLRVITTYAGVLGESELLEEIYNYMTVKDEHGNPIYLQPNYGDIPVYIRDKSFCYWDHEPRFAWQDEEYYKSEREQPGFRMSAYKRIHENRWVESETGLPMEDWDACVHMATQAGYVMPPMSGKNIQIAVGVDASTVKDRTAVVTCYKQDGRIWLGPKMYWEPTKENPINFEHQLEAYILDLHERFSISALYYDPWQFKRSAELLQLHGVPCVEYTQTQPATIKMCEYLLDLLRERKIMLYEDKALRDEATSAGIKEVAGRGRRIVKDNSNKKIDSIIALSMAALACGEVCPDLKSLQDQFMRLSTHRLAR